MNYIRNRCKKHALNSQRQKGNIKKKMELCPAPPPPPPPPQKKKKKKRREKIIANYIGDKKIYKLKDRHIDRYKDR